MSEQNYEHQPSGENKNRKLEMSRRQFLSYTLGGTGAFMMSMPLLWNVRFAVDPLLQPKTETDFVKVIEVDKVTEVPTSAKFRVHVVDGWYEHEPEIEAWIYKDEKGEIIALSPTCKHLGCRVEWNGSSQHPDEFYCPCHGAHYTRVGKALAVAKEPLDQFSVRQENGWVYLGQITPNKMTK